MTSFLGLGGVASLPRLDDDEDAGGMVVWVSTGREVPRALSVAEQKAVLDSFDVELPGGSGGGKKKVAPKKKKKK